MQIFYSEHNKDYGSYTFDYAVYAILDEIDEIPEVYSQGFLPYSGNIEKTTEVFYLARSLRVELAHFSDSSENRRVDKKMDALGINLSINALEKFDIHNKSFLKFCLDYANERFSDNAMSRERFLYILRRKIATNIFVFSDREAKPIAYVLAAMRGNTLHYWFSFLDTQFLGKFPLGKWVMWRVIQWAKENALDYVYLGTCYGEKALYKVRDFKGLSFFDGKEWNKDIKTLKHWCKTDDELLGTDRYKIC